MMRLGIYAPYNRGETSMMALRLASCAARDGCVVSWLAPTRSLPVHPNWDDEVRLTGGRDRVEAWAKRTNCRVWFAADQPAYKIAGGCTAASLATSEILVPPRHSLALADMRWLNWFDVVVCPDSTMSAKLANLAPAVTNFRICQWPSGVKACYRRHGAATERSGNVLFYADAHLCRHHGYDVLAVVATVLEANVQMKVTLSMDFAPDRREHRTLATMMDHFGDRLSAGLRPSFDALLAQVRQADWLVYMPVRATSALLLAQARSLGVPSLAWNVCPMNLRLTDGVNGVLIPCERSLSITGSETAEFARDMLTEYCLRALSDFELLARARRAIAFNDDGSASDEDFRAFWRSVIEVRAAT